MNVDMGATFLTGPARTTTRFGERAAYREGLYRVANETYAWMVPNGSWGETNLGIIRCGRSSVLVDTCWSTHHTREMLDFAAGVIHGAPIECVINTHSDGDHCWGNQLFEGREIIASHAAVRQMRHVLPGTLTAMGRACRLLRRGPSTSLARFAGYMHGMLAPYDFRDVRLTAPTTAFARTHTLCVAGVDIVLTALGPAHTDGDAIAYVPARRVVYCGDLAFIGSTPVMWSGPLENLVAALTAVLALDADVFVPGHGPLASRADLRLLIDYWEYVHAQLAAHHRSGMEPHLAAARVLTSDDFRRRPWARWAAPERLVTSAFALYRHWGSPGRAERFGPTGVLWHQAQLASALGAQAG